MASLTLHTLSDSLTLGLVSVETICRQAFWCRRQRPQPVQILARKEFLRTTGQRDEKNTHAQGQRCSRRAHDRSIVPLVAGRHTLARFVQLPTPLVRPDNSLQLRVPPLAGPDARAR